MKLWPFVCILIGISCINLAFSHDVGVIGETFPVAEMSMLEWIGQRLSSMQDNGEIAALEQRWIEQVEAHSNRPRPVGLPRTQQHSHHAYLPEVELSKDVLDAEGHVLFPNGSRVNALDKLPTYKPHWLFFDGDDSAQLAFARVTLKRWPDLKVILTGGAIGSITRELNCAVYFDQEGRLSRKLQITHVPALVLRKGHALIIHEVAIKEDGHAR